MIYIKEKIYFLFDDTNEDELNFQSHTFSTLKMEEIDVKSANLEFINLRKRNIIQNNFEILEKPSKLNNSVNSSKKKGKRGRKKKIISNQNTNGTNIKPLNQKFDINENNNNKIDDNDY